MVVRSSILTAIARSVSNEIGIFEWADRGDYRDLAVNIDASILMKLRKV